MKKISVSRRQAGLLALVTILIATNATFAVVYYTRNVPLSGGVKQSGTIQLYEGTEQTAVLTSFAFEDFIADVSDTDTIQFNIRNTGTLPVNVYWEIASPPTGWAVASDRYSYTVDSTIKYYLTINRQTGGFWQPRLGSTPDDTRIQLAAGAGAQFSMDLYYSGNPSTFDDLSLTLSFTAEST